MHSTAKILLKSITLLAVAIIAGTLLTYAFNSNFGLAVPWIFVVTIGFWMLVASICFLVLGITSKNIIRPRGKNVLSGVDYAIIGFFLLLAIDYYQQFPISSLLRLQHLHIPMLVVYLTTFSALLALIASLSVWILRTWAKYFFLALATVLTIRGYINEHHIYSGMNTMQSLFSIGISGFPAFLSLASYFYLRHQAVADA
ncbi:MAG: hypothetical protein V4563_16165 [Pseudomonadota bacterium]